MKRCKRCDITYTDEHRFCGRCGAELEAVASEGESRAHSRRGVAAVVVTAIAAVAAVAIAAIVFLGPKTDGVPVPGNTSGNIVNGGRAVETEKGAYFVSNGYHDKLAEGANRESHGAIYQTSNGENYEKVYSCGEHISNLNHCGDKFYFASWKTSSDAEPTSSLVSISDKFDPATLKTYYSTTNYAISNVNATTERAYFIEQTNAGRNIVCVDYASGEVERIYSASFLAALTLYGPYLYFLAGDDSAAACSRIVRMDVDGKNETAIYTSEKTLSFLNVGQEGLTFAEADKKCILSAIRRFQLDGNDSGLSFEMPHTYVNGLSVYKGLLYCLTTERYVNSGPAEYGTMRLVDLNNDAESTVKLDGVSETNLSIAVDHVFFSRGFDVDDKINPPAALPDPTNMMSRESSGGDTKGNDIEAAYAKNPSSVQNIDQNSHNRSEYAELTGVVREYEGRHATGTPAVVYTLDLPDSFTVVGTKYGDITSDKIVLPDSLASEYVGKTITLGAQYGARVSTGSPAFNISHVHALWTDDTQPEIIRTFD